MDKQRKQSNRSPLTQEARQAQQNIYRLWRARRKEFGMRQADLAQALQIGQAAVSQYLSGKISLNAAVVLKLAATLRVSPEEIWPGLVPDVPPAEKSLSPDVVILAREIERLSPRNREVVQSVIERFALAQHAQE